jgi:hypothetical protein
MEQAMFAHKKLRFGVFVHLEERVKEILGRNKNLKKKYVRLKFFCPFNYQEFCFNFVVCFCYITFKNCLC